MKKQLSSLIEMGTSLKTRVKIYGPMIVFTVIYLIIETSFNARLVDISGSISSSDEIRKIEIFGRCISAFAVFLAIACFIWKGYALNNKSKSLFVFFIKIFVVGIVVFPSVYIGEKLLTDFLVENSTGYTRKKALWMNTIREGMLHGHVDIDGSGLTEEKSNSPESKAFIALLPYLGASAISNLMEKTENAMPVIAKDVVSSKLGSEQNFYEVHFIKSVEELKRIYNEIYLPASNIYIKTINSSEEEAQKAWKDYLSNLKKKGLRTNEWNPYVNLQIRDAVRAKGINVPYSWKPSDKGTFVVEVKKKIKKEAKNEFRYNSERLFGGLDVEPALQWSEFYKNSEIQKYWKNKLGVTDKSRLDPQMTFQTFSRTVYAPTLNEKSDFLINQLKASDSSFIGRGTNEEIGFLSAEAMIVPLLALTLSMLGCMVHVCKLFNYILSLVMPKKTYRQIIVVTLLILTLAVPFTINNHISTSRLMTNISEQSILSTSKIVVWVVSSQGVIYPIGKILSHISGFSLLFSE